MKNRLAIIFTALLTLCLTSCGKINEIGITSTSIVSLSPVGLRGMNGVFAVGIHNPTFSFTIRNVQGVVYHKGQAMIDFSADDFTVNKKSDDVYQIKGNATLCQGVSLISALGLLKDLNAESYSVDISGTVYAKGLHKTIKRKGLPLSSLMDLQSKWKGQ